MCLVNGDPEWASSLVVVDMPYTCGGHPDADAYRPSAGKITVFKNHKMAVKYSKTRDFGAKNRKQLKLGGKFLQRLNTLLKADAKKYAENEERLVN